MIHRTAKEKVKQLTVGFPAVAVTGPRQSGKTTLVRNIFPTLPYVLLEDPDTRRFAEEDPRSFLMQYQQTGIIIDEAQNVPELFSYLQGILDNKDTTGKFILTGSQNFLMMEKISQSLTGRIGLVKLLPFELNELWQAGLEKKSYEEYLFSGLYPRLYVEKIIPSDYYAAYVQTYLERDLRQLLKVQSLSIFQTFLRMCANRVGQVVNFSSLANDCGINYKTAQGWLSLLETSFIVFLVRTHHKNFNKRLIQMPKLYFTDPGLAAYLIGIRRPKEIMNHPMKGGLFESLIMSEFLKYRYNRGLDSNLYFWRDKGGKEIDCLIDRMGLELIPVEIKAGRTISGDYFKNIEYWNKLSGQVPERSFVVYGGDQDQQRIHARVLPFDHLDPVMELL
ncbi:MAG: ATP-binding protein [Methanomicrobiales archaeon]|nr:ATP-binding protein [Methanomicrobiales archaeon]